MRLNKYNYLLKILRIEKGIIDISLIEEVSLIIDFKEEVTGEGVEDDITVKEEMITIDIRKKLIIMGTDTKEIILITTEMEGIIIMSTEDLKENIIKDIIVEVTNKASEDKVIISLKDR